MKIPWNIPKRMEVDVERVAIPSKDVRAYQKSIGFQLSDFDKMDLILNQYHPWVVRYHALAKLLRTTTDETVRECLNRLLEKERRILQEFLENNGPNTVYRPSLIFASGRACVAPAYQYAEQAWNELSKELRSSDKWVLGACLDKLQICSGEEASAPLSMHFNEKGQFISVSTPRSNNEPLSKDAGARDERLTKARSLPPHPFVRGDIVSVMLYGRKHFGVVETTRAPYDLKLHTEHTPLEWDEDKMSFRIAVWDTQEASFTSTGCFSPFELEYYHPSAKRAGLDALLIALSDIYAGRSRSVVRFESEARRFSRLFRVQNDSSEGKEIV